MSKAWRIGDVILDARGKCDPGGFCRFPNVIVLRKECLVDAIVNAMHGRVLCRGNLIDVKRGGGEVRFAVARVDLSF